MNRSHCCYCSLTTILLLGNLALAGEGWGNAGLDAILQVPAAAVDPCAAFGVASGNELLVGDPGASRVVVYLDADGPISTGDDDWSNHLPATIIDGPGGSASDKFGTSIAVWGAAALVGAPGEGNGRVYMLRRSGGVGTNWESVGYIDPPETNWSGFGTSIAMDPPFIVIGAPDGAQEGVARYEIVGTAINHVESWVSPVAAGAHFGSAVSINGTRALIGAPDADDGHALLYADPDSTGTWALLGDFADRAPNFPGVGVLGTSVLLSNLFAAVSDPGAVGPSNTGIVWAFRCSDFNPWTTSEEGTEDGFALPPPEYTGGTFGVSIVPWNNLIIVGHKNLSDGSGGVQIYQLRGTSVGNVLAWTDSIMLHDDGADDWGRTLSTAGNMLWIASNSGARGYMLDDGDIRTNADVVATVSAEAIPTGEDWIPIALDIEGSWMAAGSRHENSVVIMHEVDDEWTTVQVIDSPEADSFFGVVIGMLDGVMAIGAPDAAGGDGRVYLYTLDGDDQWVLTNTIVPAISGNGNHFGFSLDTCLDAAGRLVLVVTAPAFGIDEVKLPMPIDAGRFDVYRITDNAATVTALHNWTEFDNGASWDGVVAAAITLDGTDLLVAVSRLFRDAVDGEPFPDTFGGLSVFRSNGSEPSSTWVMESDIDAPYGRGAFGALVDIAPGVFITTSPYRGGEDSDFDSRVEVYEQSQAGEPWVATQLLRTPDVHEDHSFGGSSLATLFGQQVILAGSPRLETAAGLAGSAELFTRSGDAAFGTMFAHDLRLSMQGHHQDVRLGSSVVLDGDNLFFAGGIYTGDNPYAGDGGVVGWARLTDTTYWTNSFGGIFNDVDNWSNDPEQAARLEVSILNPNLLLILADSPTGLEEKDLHVRYAHAILMENSDDGSAMTLNRWTAWSDASIQLATTGTPGPVTITTDLHIGNADGDAGRLWCLDQVLLNVGDTYTQTSTGTLDWWFPGDFPTEPVITAANMAIGGTLSLTMPDPDYPLSVGQQFPLLRASTYPGSDADRFDLIVLPGLPDGLAMQVMYDDSAGSLVGDPWDVWVEIIELSGLLGFNDPNSLGFDSAVIDLEVVDLTADGADEICVLIDGTPGQLLVFQDDGAGGVEFQYQFNTVDDPTCIASGDFNGDGYNDLAIGSNNDEVQVFWNDDADLSTGFTLESLGTIGPVTCATSIRLDGVDPIDLLVGIDDINGDGGGSIQWWNGWSALPFTGGGLGGGGNQGTPGVPRGLDPSEEEDQKQHLGFVLFDNGSGGNMVGGGFVMGSFGLNVYAVGGDPIGIARADLDDDGIDDIAVTSAANATVAILRGTTSGYLPALQVPLGSAPGAIVAIDFNEDGRMDLAVITNNANGEPLIRVLQNEGNMQFTMIDTGGSSAPTLLAAGDVDGDGIARLVSIGGGSSLVGETSIMSLHNVDTPICPGDIDNNGAVNVDDLMALIGQWSNDCEAGATCTADLDGNLTVDVDDLVMLIGLWGPC